MSLLINGRMLETAMALKNTEHPLHTIAVEYTEGLKELREKFGQKIKFVRPGFPKRTKGVDSQGRDAMLMEPATPALFPLEKAYVHPDRGEEIWSCCLSTPKPEPQGLWSIGKKRSIKIGEFVVVDLNREPDLAYYLAYIAKFDRKGLLKIDDPAAEARERATKERRLVERKYAIWNGLDKEEDLRRLAAAYDVSGAFTKDANQLRFDLEAQLDINDKKRDKHDYTIKGTREFLEEMKVPDSVRLRAFVKRLMDEKKLIYKPDGRFRLGDKLITQVPQSEIGRKFDWLCSFYVMPANADRLQELMRDVIDKEYLDGVTDKKDLVWIAKTMGLSATFKKEEELRNLVYGVFNVTS